MEKVKSQIEFQDRDLGPRCRGLRVKDKEGSVEQDVCDGKVPT